MPSVIVYKSSTAYYIAIFAVAIAWVFIGAEQAYIVMSSIIINPINWLLLSTTILISMILPVTLISYNWKQQVIYTEPNWEFRTREVEVSEFEKIMKDYKRAYSPLMKHIDYFLLILLILSSSASVFFPFAFPFSIPLLIWGPYLFAALILVSIFLLAMFVFKASPNSATPCFNIYPEKTLRKLVTKLWDTPGVSWSGIALRIGEAEGYFLIQEAKAIGRIEGIEGIGHIECEKNNSGIYSALSILQLGPVDGTKTIPLDSGSKDLESLDLDNLVKRTILMYAELRGINEILEDVMLDLGIALSKNYEFQETDVLMSDDSDSSSEDGVHDDL